MENILLTSKNLQSEKETLDITAHLPDASFAVNSNGEIIMWNKGMEKLFGVKNEEAMGKNYTDLIYKAYGKKVNIVLDVILNRKDFEGIWEVDRYKNIKIEGNKVSAEVYLPSAYQNKGAYCWFMVSPIYDQEGNAIGFIESLRDISEKREMVSKIKKSHQFNQDIIDSLTEHVVVINKNGEIVSCNRAWSNFAEENGIESKKVGIGINYLSVCKKATEEGDKDASVVLKGLLDIIEGRKDKFTYEYPCHSPEEKRWFILNASAVQSNQGVVISHIDITSRKEQEELLEKNRKQLEEIKIKNLKRQTQMFIDILQALPIGVILIDKNFQIKHVNDVIIRMLGKNKKDVLDKMPGAAFDCYFLGNCSGSFGSGEECKNCRFQVAITTTMETGLSLKNIEAIAQIELDGVILSPVLKINTVRVKIDGEYYVLLSLDDVSNYKNIQQRLNQIIEKARLANQAKSNFLARMSHEIRTPMTGILGMTDLALNTRLDEQQKEYLNVVKSSGNNLLAVINSILDHSKIEAGKMELDTKQFILEDILNDTIQILEVKARQKGLKLVLEYQEDDAYLYQGDPLRIQQVLFNLIGNAIKFTEKGSITIRQKIEQVFTEEDSLLLRFDIIDTGIGISEEKIDSLFDDFTQLDSTNKHLGTGLGLAISKELVEMMGGSIEVSSKIDQGSTFSFTVKLNYLNKKKLDLKSQENLLEFSEIEEQSQNKDFKSLENKNNKGSIIDNSSIKILMADDDQINCKLVSAYLKKRNYDFTIVNDGKKALEEYQKYNYDLILLDMMMPEINGLELTKKIRKYEHSQKKHIPIIAMTARAMKEDKEKCLQAGMDGFISKPIKADLFFAVLEKQISNNTLAHVDNTKISQVMREDKELLTDLIENLLSNYHDTIAKIKNLYKNEDFTELSNNIHKFKGSIANFGALKAVALLENIEEDLRKKNYQKLSQSITLLEGEMKFVRAHLLDLKEGFNYENIGS